MKLLLLILEILAKFRSGVLAFILKFRFFNLNIFVFEIAELTLSNLSFKSTIKHSHFNGTILGLDRPSFCRFKFCTFLLHRR